MPSKLSRWLVICASCVVLSGWFESTVAAQGQRNRWPLIHVADPVAHRATLGALEAAAGRLAEDACREILTDFEDTNGRSLATQLSSVATDFDNYLRMITFVDGTRDERCDSGAVLFTAPGSRVVRVCSDQLKRIAPLKPEYVVASFIHEILHTLGLGENPPSPSQITARVVSRCGFHAAMPLAPPGAQMNAPGRTTTTDSMTAGCSKVGLGLWLGNHAGVPGMVVNSARTYVEAIYRAIGIQVQWREDPGDRPRPLVVVVVPDTRARAFGVRDISSLGVALQGQGGGASAFVFYDRVEHAATKNRVDAAMVLGAALAHEIAHGVLGRGAHAHSGLMRASWEEQEFRLIKSGLPLFTSLERQALRNALQSAETAACGSQP